MASATRKCKVCGKDYEYCHTVRRTSDIFRWQDVACCPEHGSTYFAAVLAARNEAPADEFKNESTPEIVENIIENTIELDEDEDDEFDDEYDEDDEDEDDE